MPKPSSLPRLCLSLAACVALAACAPAPLLHAPAVPAATRAGIAPPLVGRAVFPGRRLAATTADVAIAATVSLIDADDNATRATALTTPAGDFNLTWPNGFTPVLGQVYVLEAVKGLGDNLPGSPAVRIRTLVQLHNDGWHSITNSNPHATLEINTATTALAIGAGLRHHVVPGDLIGAYNPGTLVFTPVVGLAQADLDALEGIVTNVLAGNGDPVASVSLDSEGSWLQVAGRASPQVNALGADAVQPGSTLVLEGSFGQDAQVQVPGFGVLPLGVNGAHRAQLVWPAGATSGNLVITGGAGSASLPVLATSFAQGISHFETEYDQAGTGRAFPRLSVGRAGAKAIATSSAVYVLGGNAGGTLYDTIERAALNADGQLGPFATLPGVRLNVPRTKAAVVVLGDDVYVIGGETSGVTMLTSVEHATIDANGNLSNFTLVPGTNLTSPRCAVGLVVVGNYVYVVGGDGGGTWLTDVQRAPIGPTGQLGAFQAVPGSTLLEGRAGHAAVVAGSRLYVMGGYRGVPTATIESAPILADGNIGTFSAHVRNLKKALVAPSTAVLGNTLYLVGGFTSDGSRVTDLARATFSPAGVLADFEVVEKVLSEGREHQASAVVGNQLYVFGGFNGTNSLASVERAALDAPARLGEFQPVMGALPVGSGGVTSAVAGRSLYVIGGDSKGDPTNLVQRLEFDPAGALAGSGEAGQLLTARTGASSVVIGDRLYVSGGRGPAGLLADTETAEIGNGGTLGDFTVSAATLPAGRAGHRTLALGDRLYLLGGEQAGGTTASIAQATVTGGLPGEFTDTAFNLQVARSGHAVVVLGRQAYVLGGRNGATTLSSVEVSPIGTEGQLADFTLVAGVKLVGERADFQCAVVGNHLYVFGGGSDTVERATIDSQGRLGPFVVVPGASLAGRGGFASAVLGNALYLAGGYGDSSEGLAAIQRAWLW